MKRRRTEWVLVRLSKKKMQNMELAFVLHSAFETNTLNVSRGSFKRFQQKKWAYHLAFKRWLARKELQGMLLWKDEVRG